MHQPIALNGNSLTLEKAKKISQGTSVKISKQTENTIRSSRNFLESLIQKGEKIYGVNTGYGYLAKEKVSEKQLKQLQKNLVKSHASGYGDPLSIEEARLTMALRLNVMCSGLSGVRFELCHYLQTLINHDAIAYIPEYGSVGASGDLTPLAHLALLIIGEGKAFYKGKLSSAKQILKKLNIPPLELAEKEGLSLVNGTQAMCSIGALSLIKAKEIVQWAHSICALSCEGLLANPSFIDPLVHKARKQKGQMQSAKELKKALKGSFIFSKSHTPLRLQDSYSLRCSPQVHGACIDALLYATNVIEDELNATTDNPLVFHEEKKVISGGNFHGEPLAIALDAASIALSEIANLSERRLELLLNPQFNKQTPFLAPEPGLQSAHMATQYLSASLVNEIKLLANPASTDSIPGNVGIEDHVSMGMTSARKFKKICTLVPVVLAAEWIAAAQALDLRYKNQQPKLGEKSGDIYQLLRKKLPALKQDRIMHEDINIAVSLIEDAIKWS